MGIKGVFKAIARPLRPGAKSRRREQASPPRKVEVQRVLSISRPLDIDTTSSDGEQEPLPAELEGLHPPEPPATASTADVGLRTAAEQGGASKTPLSTPQKGDRSTGPPTASRNGGDTSRTDPAASPLPISAPNPPHVPDLEELAAGSPFIDIDNPIDAREAAKLILMLPVVLLRVCAGRVCGGWHLAVLTQGQCVASAPRTALCPHPEMRMQTLLLLVTVIVGYVVMVALMTLIPGRGKRGRGARHILVQAWIQVLCHAALFLSGFFSVRVTGREHLKQAKVGGETAQGSAPPSGDALRIRAN